MPFLAVYSVFCAFFCVTEAAVILNTGNAPSLVLHRDPIAATPLEVHNKILEAQNVDIPSDAAELPALKTLEFLRSTPVHDLDACAADIFCTKRLRLRLDALTAHPGAVEMLDIMVANFCLRPPISNQLKFCRKHDFSGLTADLADHADSEYNNQDLVACLVGLPRCLPDIQQHLTSLLFDKQTAHFFASSLKVICRTNAQPYVKGLFACKAKKI